jgi:hypothetical protein
MHSGWGFWPAVESSSRHRLPARPKRRTELRIAIVQHIAAGMKIAPSLLRRAASDLLHPLLVRMPGDVGYVDPSALQVQKEQYIISHQSAPTEHFHREQITRASTFIWAARKSFQEVTFFVWEPEQCRGAGGCSSRTDPTAGDQGWREPRRCGHIPIPSSLAPSGPPGLRLLRKQEGGRDTAGVLSLQTSGRPASDTKPGWCRVWQRKRLPEVLSVPSAFRSRPGLSAPGWRGAIAAATWFSRSDSRRRGTGSAIVVPGSPSRSRRPRGAPIRCSSCSRVSYSAGDGLNVFTIRPRCCADARPSSFYRDYCLSGPEVSL